MLRVLVVISDPLSSNLSPVAALQEWQAINRAMAHQQVPVTLFRLFPPTWQHLRQTLLGRLGPFDVVHFIGHGNAAELIMEDEFGRIDRVSAIDLANAFTQRGVKLVILNVCESESPARALVQTGLPSVVATARPITNRQAIVLAQELYGALAAKQTLAQAMAQAKIALRRSEGRGVSDIPVVVGDNSIHFNLPHSDSRIPRSNTLNFPKHNLRQPAAFFGRLEELQQGLQLLATTDVRVLQITGLGGIGKTSFGLQLAHRSAWRFFGGVVWISADTVDSSFGAHLAHRTRDILSSIRLTGEPTAEFEAVLSEIAQYPVLLIFDDPDRMPGELVKDLSLFLNRLPLQSGSKAILVTRTRMFALDNADAMAVITLRGLDPDSARRFLRHRAYLQRVTELANASDTTLDAIADRLGYHPKMLELAVGLIRMLGLIDGQRALSRLPEPFAQKLEALVAKAVATLTPADIEVLRVASTFVGPFTRAWLVGVGDPQAMDSLPALIDSNLIDRDEVTDYYELHPVVKDYIAGTMPLGPEHLQAHARFFAEQVSLLAPALSTREIQDTRREFNRLVGEVREAVQRMRVLNDNEAHIIVKDLAAGVRDYLHLHRRDWLVIQSLDEAAVEACRVLEDHAGLGAALTSLGAALAAQRKLDEGLAKCSEGIDYLTSAGDAHLQSIGYGALGFVNRMRGEMMLARQNYEQGLNLAREIDDLSLEVRHLSNLGTVHRWTKNWEKAKQLYQQALNLALKSDDQLSVAILLDNLGTNARGQGDLDISLRYHQQAYQLKEVIGDIVGLRITRNSLAATLKQLGRAAEAIPLLEETLRDLDENAGALEWWQVLLQLARMHRELEAWETARDYYELALEMARAAQYPKGISMCERGIGLCYEGEGCLRLANEHILRSIELSGRISDPYLPNLLKDQHRIEDALMEAGNG